MRSISASLNGSLTAGTRLWVYILVVTATALGCGGQRSLDEAPTPTKGHCSVGEPPVLARDLELVPAFEHVGLSRTERLGLVELVASPWVPGEWYLVRQGGQILRFSEDPSVPGHEVALDLADQPDFQTGRWEEDGLGSMALHPTRREAYVVYTSTSDEAGAQLDSRLVRYDVDGQGDLVRESETLILNLPQPRPAHSGDHVAFGPEGYLYYSAGDGGRPRDAGKEGQDPYTLNAAILRLDVDQEQEEWAEPYAIPADNPFADGEGGAPEVYAYGFRNPWRFSFDRDTGELWAGDVGENDWEEINRVEAGGNYGWSTTEGEGCFRADDCDREDIRPPVFAYPHDDGISVIGGFVYRGSDIPGLQGRYVFADYIFGTIWSLDASAEPGGDPDVRTEAQAPFWISSFAQGRDGELYVVNFTFGTPDRPKEGEGGLYALRPVTADAPPASGFRSKLSDTGCVDMVAPRAPAPGLRAFTPRATLYSDGAAKDRFVYVPDGEGVSLKKDGDFVFPTGTVLVKHFRFGKRLHETRLFVHHEELGWRGYSYRWNDAQTDAEWLATGKNEVLQNGTYWRYPSPTQCGFCHTEAAGDVLGPESIQLDFPAATGSDGSDGTLPSQLADWYEAGVFTASVTQKALEAPRDLVDPFGEANLDDRARSYLHVNCAHCHRPGGVARVHLDLRFQTPLDAMGLCDETPELGTLGGDPDLRRLLAPGDPDNSVLLLRMQSESGPRMPPLATRVVDKRAVKLMRRWIGAIDGCGE